LRDTNSVTQGKMVAVSITENEALDLINNTYLGKVCIRLFFVFCFLFFVICFLFLLFFVIFWFYFILLLTVGKVLPLSTAQVMLLYQAILLK
jgi:hypothetical protein